MMKIFSLGICGWLIPGGVYLMMRRYVQFAVFAVVISAAFAAGLANDGGYQWPQSADLDGLDGFTALLFKGGTLMKWIAGGPFLLARVAGDSPSFLNGRLHEYGSTLLILAGALNLLAISSALELRKVEKDTCRT